MKPIYIITLVLLLISPRIAFSQSGLTEDQLDEVLTVIAQNDSCQVTDSLRKIDIEFLSRKNYALEMALNDCEGVNLNLQNAYTSANLKAATYQEKYYKEARKNKGLKKKAIGLGLACLIVGIWL